MFGDTIKNNKKDLIKTLKEVCGKIIEAQARQELIKGINPTLKSSKEFRPIAQLVKSEEDKNKAIPIFLEVDKFVRDFATKYFNPN